MSDHPADSTSMEETYSDIHFYIQANIRWQGRNADELKDYFDNQPALPPIDNYRMLGIVLLLKNIRKYDMMV